MIMSKSTSKPSKLLDFMFCAGFVLGFCLCFMAIAYYKAYQISQETVPLPSRTISLLVLSPLPPTPSSGRLLCWVWTRAKHIVNTWGPRCDTLLFMSSKPDLLFPGTVLALATEEGRANLYNKTMAAFNLLHDGYLDRADWFLKADDDTYVIVENLRLLLSRFSPDKPVYLGRRFRRFVHQGYMSGGAGYVLSRESVRRYVRALHHGACTQSTSAEDLLLGFCHQKLGVPAGDSRDHQHRETFHPLWLGKLLCTEDILPKWFHQYNYYPSKVGPDCCSNSSVSFHYVEPVRMYMLDYFLYHLSPVGGHNPKLGETREE
ncbi:glycoprotein-N-acetylgalactosamine 3-beta-galactosyltransferase 1-like [Oncorhynchus kisutch]|uniref:N-acetylgalactosaminide beta-1,3-galactosyltransferase n=1 Tax=Oncorhynchus kisutch TaxID=8019 RepID=A0A8C7IUJ3_ONCKI|nr:glycoprotein-N-acetylgalactosamine 3-beta-galactosyltransferase 1-like [Oncorhynchus kisutch]XP_031683827.1 glycoprotein-N-acetylgalactosamine 3-beta-galactosyltransferase 1-like [Oncorhynchus kisutch]